MLRIFKKKVNVQAVLERAVVDIDIYHAKGDPVYVEDAFRELNKVYPLCDEHVRLQLMPILIKYDSLYNGIGVYDGFLYTASHVLNYCLFYLSVSSR